MRDAAYRRLTLAILGMDVVSLTTDLRQRRRGLVVDIDGYGGRFVTGQSRLPPPRADQASDAVLRHARRTGNCHPARRGLPRVRRLTSQSRA